MRKTQTIAIAPGESRHETSEFSLLVTVLISIEAEFYWLPRQNSNLDKDLSHRQIGKVKLLCNAIGQIRRGLGGFFCPRITLIDANDDRVSHCQPAPYGKCFWSAGRPLTAFSPTLASTQGDTTTCRTPKASRNRATDPLPSYSRSFAGSTSVAAEPLCEASSETTCGMSRIFSIS